MENLLLFLLIIHLIHGLGTWKLYSKAGYKSWEAFIPIYSIIILMKIINRSKWWIFLLILPVINVIMIPVIWVELSRSFGKNSYTDTLLSIVSLGFYNYYLNYFTDVKYVTNRDTNPKSSNGEWTSSLIFAIVAATIIHTYFIQPYTIPTSSLPTCSNTSCSYTLANDGTIFTGTAVTIATDDIIGIDWTGTPTDTRFWAGNNVESNGKIVVKNSSTGGFSDIDSGLYDMVYEVLIPASGTTNLSTGSYNVVGDVTLSYDDSLITATGGNESLSTTHSIEQPVIEVQGTIDAKWNESTKINTTVDSNNDIQFSGIGLIEAEDTIMIENGASANVVFTPSLGSTGNHNTALFVDLIPVSKDISTITNASSEALNRLEAYTSGTSTRWIGVKEAGVNVYQTNYNWTAGTSVLKLEVIDTDIKFYNQPCRFQDIPFRNKDIPCRIKEGTFRLKDITTRKTSL